ncbi:uncharacterized protein, partial [Fopius arisanus]|uniref:Bub1 protein n=1 Tax=Fopius arisanus TaxID=64838 RepID=A0A9R1SZ86_9HYME
ITLCKENIQPLRHGRNATQLGTALRAQEDVEAQQLLLQEKQKYEDAIKDYEGDDPLEMWYEYILWVEQSYPKSGHESHIGKLLQQCLAAFEKETKYHQDRRYIRLWINYISMQKNPLELYQLLYNNGIGTMVADTYRAWAFELEQVNDNKRADEVYDLGLRARAEPLDELSHAHANFQFAVARKTLGRMEERNEVSLLEQRQAFSSLRAIKSGRRATHVRTGQRVRDYQPGVVPQGSQVPIGRGNAKIQIYQDEPEPLEPRGSSILDHVPIEETVHKENTIKAGPWSNAGRKHPLIPPSAKTSFKIHEDRVDDNFDTEKLHLYPNHVTFFDGRNYPEHKTVPVFVPEQPSAMITKTFYPKDLVYANNMDRSMEEIRAERYFKQRRIQEKMHYENPEGLMNGQNMQKPHEMERRSYGDEGIERLKFEAEQKREKERLDAEQREMERRQVEQMEMERQRREEMERMRREEIERQRREEIERQRREEIERQRREEIERQRREEIERQRQEEMERERQEEMERQRREEIERQRIEAERIEAERIESQRMEAELSRQRKIPQNYLHHTSANCSLDPSMEHLLGQSITVNTKEAMSVVQDLWHSPNESTSPIVPSPMQHRMPKNEGKMECAFNEPMEEVEEEEFVLPTGDFNPFDKGLISGLLRKIKFPRAHHSDGYHRMNMNLNKMLPSSVVTLGTDTYEMERKLGKGTYGTVMKAVSGQTGQAVALKTQRPAWVWEYYIAREIKARITNPHMLRGFMDISKAYVTNNASVLVSEYSKYGTLLSVTNQVKVATGKPLHEALAITFTLEMLQIVEYLHKCQIIHGDIKPDNFLLMHLPTEDVRPTIQLIDFGCSIDMSLFPEGTKFTQIIKTEDFTCIEMQTGRPWTYQTDLYCLAASAHCLLFGNYMRVAHTGDKWFITAKMPRYVKRAAWEIFFTELLNIESCEKMPDLSALRSTMEEALANTTNYDQNVRYFANVLNKR